MITFNNNKGFHNYVREHYGTLKSILKQLPKKEQDILRMYFELGKEQKEIATVLGLTQGGVSHRMSKSRRRIQYLLNSVLTCSIEGRR